jgi:hypothetical protein
MARVTPEQTGLFFLFIDFLPNLNMVLDLALDFFRSMAQINTFLLFIIFFVFVIFAYKVFQTVIRAFIVGVIAATFPIVGNLMGMNIPLTITSIIWFAIFGVAAYLLYSSIRSGARIIGLIFRPFRGLFGKKPVQKIIIKEKEKT